MKATDLMIGDWVKIGDADKYHGYFGKVRAINSITGYCIVGAMIDKDIFTAIDVFINDIEPIPLTPEMLEKNGFYKGWVTVHKLQHTLRICGLDELADNFKI